MISGLIFDFDGLILDTEHPQFCAWQEIYARHGCELQLNSWVQVLGTDTPFDPFTDLAAAKEPPTDQQSVLQNYRERCDVLIRQEPLLPGVKETITAARAMGIKLAVASSSDRPWVEGHLDRFDLVAEFDCIYTREDVVRVKPAPDLFEKALKGLGIASNQALVFEDSPNGILAARAAGIYAAAVPNRVSAQLDLSHANRILSRLPGADLPGLLSDIEAELKLERESSND